MKKLFNVKSLLLALLLVCVFGVVGAYAADPTPTPTPVPPTYCTEAEVVVDGVYYLKTSLTAAPEASAALATDYYSVKKADSSAPWELGTKVDAAASWGKDGSTDTTGGKTMYYRPVVKLTYDGTKDEVTVKVYNDEATAINLDVYAVGSAGSASTKLSKKGWVKFDGNAAGVKINLEAKTDKGGLNIGAGKAAFVYVMPAKAAPTVDIATASEFLAIKVGAQAATDSAAVDVSAVNVNWYMMDSDDEAARDGVLGVEGTTKPYVFTAKGKKGDKKTEVDLTAADLIWKTSEDAHKDWASITTFTPALLYTECTAEKPAKLYVRLKGVSVTTEAKANDASFDAAKRPGKDKNVTFKKQGKAPSVTVDVKLGTIKITNKCEYIASAAKLTEATDPKTKDYTLWTTILPQNKDGKATSPTITGGYVPVAKCIVTTTEVTGTESKYTTEKVASINVEAGKYYYVRTAATFSAPASATVEVYVPAQADAPAVSTPEEVNYVAGKVVELKVPTIANATGDTAATIYEYAVIEKEDYRDVVWSSVKWKTIKAGDKIKISQRTAYYTVEDELNAKLYGDKAKAREHRAAYSDKVVILIRRAGVKDGNILPSEVAFTTVTVTTGENGKYTWSVKDDQAAAGCPTATPTPTPTSAPSAD